MVSYGEDGLKEMDSGVLCFIDAFIDVYDWTEFGIWQGKWAAV